MAQRKADKTENWKISIQQITFKKAVGPNGTVTTMAYGKAWSAQGALLIYIYININIYIYRFIYIYFFLYILLFIYIYIYI